MPIIDIFPLDKAGLALNRTPSERIWSKLTNVAFKNGALTHRPGFKTAYGYENIIATEPRPANGLVEIWNPGSTNEGRSAGEWVTETLRPDGSASLVAGWTASATTLHGDTDEAVPDGNHALTSTIGSMFSLTFANPSGTYTDILGLRFLVRAKVEYNTGNASAVLNLYQRYGSTNALIGTETVYAYDVNETAYWYDFSFFLEKNLQTGLTWEDSELDGLQVALEFASGAEEITYYLAPSAITGTSGWVDAVDGGAAAVADITLSSPDTTNVSTIPDGVTPSSFPVIATTGHGLSSSTADTTVVVIFSDITGATFSDIDQVEVNFRVRAPKYVQCGYEIYYNNGSTDTLIGSGLIEGSCRPFDNPYIVTMTTNPVSGSAWTQAQVDAASFKFKIKDSTSEAIVMEYATATVSGTKNTSNLKIDTVAVEIMAPGGTNPPNRLILTNKSMLRYQIEDTTLDDVTNSVASQSLPSIAPFDWAILYGQVYVVNGIDNTKRYPTVASVFESLTTNNAGGATPITGRTVAAFANRILYGWVKDNTTYTPERIAYSKIFDGGTHDHVSAGDFDLIDTMGGVVALRQLNESLCFAGKQKGIYALRATGNAAAPIVPDPIDYDTGCLSRASAVRAVVQGKPVILFLGSNASDEVNVFMFDGSSVRAVGAPIAPLLNNLANPKMFNTAIGGIDGTTNSYVLFLASGRNIYNNFAVAMNLNTLQWTRWDMSMPVFSAASWSMPANNQVVSQSGTLGGNLYQGLTTLVLGGENNLALMAHSLPFDVVMASNDNQGNVQPGANTNGDGEGPGLKDLFISTMETGDIQLVTPEGALAITSFRVHLDYLNLGPVRFGISYSEDGGLTYTTEDFYTIGDTRVTGSIEHAFFDLDTPANAHKIRVRIRTAPNSTVFDIPYSWQINRIYIEHGVGAMNGA